MFNACIITTGMLPTLLSHVHYEILVPILMFVYQILFGCRSKMLLEKLLTKRIIIIYVGYFSMEKILLVLNTLIIWMNSFCNLCLTPLLFTRSIKYASTVPLHPFWNKYTITDYQICWSIYILFQKNRNRYKISYLNFLVILYFSKRELMCNINLIAI